MHAEHLGAPPALADRDQVADARVALGAAKELNRTSGLERRPRGDTAPGADHLGDEDAPRATSRQGT